MMFVANRDAVAAVNAMGVEITLDGAAAFIKDVTKSRRAALVPAPTRIHNFINDTE